MIKYPGRLDLSAVDPRRHEEARWALLDGNMRAFVSTTDHVRAWQLVRANRGVLLARLLYERAAVEALTLGKENNLHLPEGEIRRALHLFFHDRNLERLRSAYPLPGEGPWALYRGVAGLIKERRVRGISWTRKLEVARWYAERSGLEKPAVYRAVIPARHVLAYLNGREEEFVAVVPQRFKVEQV
jgi:hypothetical protein